MDRSIGTDVVMLGVGTCGEDATLQVLDVGHARLDSMG
jgi:hypothetical protein